MLNKISKKVQTNILKSHLAKKITGSFGLKLSLVALSFLTSIYLARMLSAEGYGTYSYAVTWISVLQIPAVLGFRELLLKEVSVYASKGENNYLHGLLRLSKGIGILVTSLLVIVSLLYIRIKLVDTNPQLALTFGIALVSLPMLVLTALRQGTMQGLGRVVISQVPEMLIQPVALILFLLIFYFLVGTELESEWAILFRVIATGIAFVVGDILLNKTIPVDVKKAVPKYQANQWIKRCLPFVLISCTYVINRKADILMLGALHGTESVGIYTVVGRGSDFLSFILVAVNASIAPSISRLYSQQKLGELQRLITRSTRIVFLYSLTLTIILTIFGKWFLLIFGSDFVQGYSTLVILNLGKLFNAFAGSVGLLLNMTGHEKKSALVVGFSAILNIILNAVLIPRYGADGAAIATATSFFFWNGISLFLVKKYLGINSTIFV